jgi:hypothetical protein
MMDELEMAHAPSRCELCGRVWPPLQPYVDRTGARSGVVWRCAHCIGVEPDLEAVPVSYVHPRYRSGLHVYVHPTIRSVHPQSPCAGQIVQTCVGVYYPALEALGERHHSTMVPVRLRDGRELLVEEEYVSAD